MGQAGPGSIRVCGDAIYWHQADAAPTHTQIKRWRKSEGVDVVYRSPDPDLALTSSVACADGWLTLTRAFTGVGDAYDQVLAAHLR